MKSCICIVYFVYNQNIEKVLHIIISLKKTFLPNERSNNCTNVFFINFIFQECDIMGNEKAETRAI